jgi:hypothetical protein
MPKKLCKICGKKADSDYCFQHKARKRIPTNTSRDVLILEEMPSMRDFFISIWKKREHRSEVSGEYLGNEPLSVFFHHILPKEKHKQAALDDDNIILLTLDEHSNVENDMYKYEEVNARRDLLKVKYDL